MKGDRSPSEFQLLLKNIQSCIKSSNNFENTIWHEYIEKKQSSTSMHPDPYLNRLLSIKWKQQKKEERPSKWSNASSDVATTRYIACNYTESQAIEYLRSFQYRDSIFNLPIRQIITRFGSWNCDR